MGSEGLVQPAHAPASVAQLEVRPNCYQEFAGSIPAGSAAFFRGDLTISPFR